MEFTAICYLLGYISQFSWLIIWGLRLIWETFISKGQHNLNGTLINTKSDIRLLINFLILLIISIYVTEVNIDFISNSIYINQLICSELIIFWGLMISILVIMERTHTSQTILTTEVIILFNFLILTGTLLLTASNLLYLFFIIELMGFIILYTFLILNTNKVNNITQSNSNIVTSLIYQFILNFFGSILFYFGLIWLLYYHGSTSNKFLVFSQFTSNSSFWCGLILIALLIKFGTGPWICYKVKIYNNITFLALSIYTIIYFSVIFILLLNLLFIFNTPFTLYLGIFMGLIMIFAIIFFSAVVFQYGRIQLFLGLSSLLNTTLFFLQIFSILI